MELLEKALEIGQSDKMKDEFFEEEPIGLNAGVRIMGLRKVMYTGIQETWEQIL